ncbi:MAG TPA: hypothetical protein VM940_04825 [Chthoniobacterales bacterium]|jgi:hypothetical protein|nr:hypothetical protein [Chthoniobacterales bacterium]
MRLNNWKHLPWFVFVVLATVAASTLYLGNFYPERLPSWLRLPPALIQTPTEHHTVGGTPLGLWFGAISLAIFVFAALLSLRKKIPLWRIGTVQRWLRAHIWLTFLTIPLILLHSGFRFGGPMTTLLMALYAVVMVSGVYGLFLQHLMPRLMKERLPAETVFEQIPHIRSQLVAAAEKMRDSFKPAPPAAAKKPDAGAPAPSPTKSATSEAPVMASTKGELSTPVARAKSATGSEPIAASVVAPANPEKPATPPPPSMPNAAVPPAPPKPETIGTPTARVQSDPPGAPVARADVPAGDQAAPTPAVAPAAPSPPAEKTNTVAPAPAVTSASASSVPGSPKPATAPVPPKPATPAAAKPAAPKPVAKPAAPADPASEEALVEFIDRQVLPYLEAGGGDRMRLNNRRFAEDTFRFAKLRVAEGYRSRVDEIEAWCDERRMLDLQVRLHHWLHGWLFVHVPFSFLLLLLTIWHAFVTLFYY